MTVDKALSIFKKKFPSNEVIKACEYKGNYLFAAPEKSLGAADMSNPFFIVNKLTGKITGFVPTTDLKGFQEAMSKHEIKI